jgi:hypothetical protein
MNDAHASGRLLHDFSKTKVDQEKIMKASTSLIAALSIGLSFACSNTPEPVTPESEAAADEARDARSEAEQAQDNADQAETEADVAEDVAKEEADVAKEEADVEAAEQQP